MTDKWTQKQRADDLDSWKWNVADGIYGLAIQYANTDDYNWQAVRGAFRLSGIEEGRTAAMHMAEEILALPTEEFNRRVAVELFDRLKEIERNIHTLYPSADILPGYHAGYEAGVADTKRRIVEAMVEAPNK